jgi:hypothetical protein
VPPPGVKAAQLKGQRTGTSTTKNLLRVEKRILLLCHSIILYLYRPMADVEEVPRSDEPAKAPEPPICASCSYLDNDPSWSEVPNESSFAELQASVERGDCRSCKLIWDAIHLFDLPDDLSITTLQKRNMRTTFSVEIKCNGSMGPAYGGPYRSSGTKLLEFHVLQGKQADGHCD